MRINYSLLVIINYYYQVRMHQRGEVRRAHPADVGLARVVHAVGVRVRHQRLQIVQSHTQGKLYQCCQLRLDFVAIDNSFYLYPHGKTWPIK